MDINLKNKNALVCGASKGIGKAVAMQLAEMGANVTLVARTAAKLAEAKNQLFDSGLDQKHDYLVADFEDSKDLRKKVLGLVALKPIHILINNTGGPSPGPILDAQEEDFTKALHNHLICSHLLTKLVLKGMRKEKFGRIINIISTSVREPILGLGVSNTTRGAMASWAKTLSNELAQDGITVNNVLPGATNTERLKTIAQGQADKLGISLEETLSRWADASPMKRIAEPAEIAAAVGFLASPAASYITGISLPVDGGRIKSL